jgi:hypothetical protein
MIRDTLTIENLEAIQTAMNKIKETDRSKYFKQYAREVSCRLECKYAYLDSKKEKQI